MRLVLGSGYTFNTAGERMCDECHRASTTQATITHDDGTGYGGTYCRYHSLWPSRVEIGKATVAEVLDLWAAAERTARSARTFGEYVAEIRRSIGGAA